MLSDRCAREEKRFVWRGILAILCAAAVVILIRGMASGFAAPAYAYVPEPTMVQQVKLYKCWVEIVTCPADIEEQANEWLQKNMQAHIVERVLKTSEKHVVLAIFHEVPEWRNNAKQPAEKP